MEIKKILEGIQTRLKTEMFDTVGDKVFIMASKVAVPKSYHFPYIAIIYNSGIPSGKKDYGITYHEVDVFVFQSIWNEEFVITGTTSDEGNNKGLMSLLGDIETALKDYELPAITGINFLSQVTNYYGTEDWITDGKYSASTGLRIKYGVEYW